ncbi:TadG family pilus assembly protein [Stenotrophomonas tumulicola]
MLLLMIGLVAMLGLVEIGYLYWAKRDAQKVADLSAIAGAQRLDLCNTSYSNNTAARINAEKDNAFPGQLEIHCGNWNAVHAAADHFVQGVSEGNPLNAVRVIASRSVIPFFGQNESLPTVTAQAVAKRSAPSAVFSVGSQLLRINGDTPLGNVLKLVGVDLNATTVLGYDGLANAHITPGGLLEALGIPVDANISIGDFNALLAANKVSLGSLLDASASVLARSGVTDIDLKALRDALGLELSLDDLAVQLGSDDGSSGLFAKIIAPDGSASSALQADVNLLDLITTGITIASDGRGVAVNNLNLLGLVQVKAGVVEPPSIAIGGVGARAYNAQVRLFANIDTNNIPAVGGLLGLLGTRLNLPLHVDVTNAMGTLTSLQCSSSPPTATIQVDASVLRACVGKVGDADRFSKTNVCDAGLQNEQLLTLLGIPLINNQIKVNALADQQSITLAAGETGSTQINKLALGNTVSELTTQLLNVLSGMLNPRGNGLSTSDTAYQLAERYLLAGSNSNGTYNIERTITLLEHGSKDLGIEKLGSWQIKKGVPEPCVLGLFNCFRDGTVWEGFRATVTGQGSGLLPGLLGTLLGGLVVERCNSVVGSLDYKNCAKRNLASYIQTNTEEGFLDQFNGGGVTAPGNEEIACTGILCIVLKGPLDLLKPLLNNIGSLLSDLLANLLGLELGRTDVHVQSIQCGGAQLVY